MLALYFALATAFHPQRSEPPIITIVITVLCAFIAYGLFKVAPIAAKT